MNNEFLEIDIVSENQFTTTGESTSVKIQQRVRKYKVINLQANTKMVLFIQGQQVPFQAE